jgi:hypothetical protein
MRNLLHLQLPVQQLTVTYSQFITDALRQKTAQALIDYLLLWLVITVPIDNLVRKTLAPAAYGIANTSGTHTDTRSLNRAFGRFDHGGDFTISPA